MGSNEWQDMPIGMDLPSLRWQVALFGSDSEGHQPLGRITDVGEAVRYDAPCRREHCYQQVRNSNTQSSANSSSLAGAAKNPQCVLRQEFAIQPHYRLGDFGLLRKHGGELNQKRVGIGTQHPAPVAYMPIGYR